MTPWRNSPPGLKDSGRIKLAVVTPYHQESLSVLENCHRSVLAQEFPALHVMVGDGHSRKIVDQWDCHHIGLPLSHNDIGSTPRLIGAFHAIGLGAEGVAFLDADNWYQPQHLRRLMELQAATGASFISSGRTLCRLDGSVMGPCTLTNPERFIDTSCMLFMKGAFHLLHEWVLMPDYGHLIGDRIMLHRVVSSRVTRAHSSERTVMYRCGKEGLYRQLGEPVPVGVAPRPNYEDSFRRWVEDGNDPIS